MSATETELRELSYLGAVNEALHQIMAEDPDVFCAGEDVGASRVLKKGSRSGSVFVMLG